MTNNDVPSEEPAAEVGRTLSPSEFFSLTAAGHLSEWDYDPDAPLVCRACDWHGTGEGLEELYSGLFDVKCPECGCILLVVSFATEDETRAAAAAGNSRAAESLPHLDERTELQRLRDEHELADPAQLPALDGESLAIDWDLVGDGGHVWTVIRHEDNELWREPAYYEGAERFRAVARILQAKYGAQLVELRPTPDSTMYLYGDSFAASGIVGSVNEALRNRRPF